jgi:site-specific DNA-adenine methylase
MKTPFSYFGGKRQVADQIWQRLGDPTFYYEPFVGAGGSFLGRPTAPKREVIGDSYCLVTNFWRAAKLAKPEELAELTAWPLSQLDLTARDSWLAAQKDRLHHFLSTDPFWYDLRCAAWYSWKNCVRMSYNAFGHSLNLGGSEKGVLRKRQNLAEYFAALKQRLSNVIIHYGDWTRLTKLAESQCRDRDGAILFDPPYLYATGRKQNCYAHDSPDVAGWVKRWAVARATTHPRLRITLCGWQGEHEMPPDWEALSWRTRKGASERIWFSPNCLKPESSR